MNDPVLNLAEWIERRKSAIGPYCDHIVHSVKHYETHITEQAAEIERLREALKVMTEHYVILVSCGDCGHWDPEEEQEVKLARAVLGESK